MKALFLILALFSVHKAMAQGDLSGSLKGQYSAQKGLFGTLEVKNKQSTKTGPVSALIEERNLLENGSFEHQSYLTGWTTSGAATFDRETTIVRDGKASAKVVTTGNSFNFTQDSTLYAGQITGNGYISIWIHNTAPGVQVCSRNAGADKDCQAALTDGVWHEYIVPVVFGATSNGVSIHSGTTAGTTYIDWGRLIDIDATGSAPIVGPRVSYTPVTQGLGVITPASNACTYSQIGPSILLECKMSGGTVAASELRVGLPSGMTIASGFTGYRSFDAGFRDISTTPGRKIYSIIGQSGNSYVNFSSPEYSETVNPLVPQLANSILGNGQNFSFSAIIPIAELASSVPVYYDRCKDPRNCETVFSGSSTGSATPGVASENLDWISSITRSTTGDYTFSLNSGIFSVAPECSCTAVDPLTGARSNSCYIVSVSTTSVRTNTVQGGVGSVDLGRNITCQRQGQDYLNAKVNQIVGSFKDYVKTPNTTTGKVGFCSAKISATGVISDQLGGCFASCTNATTPVCTFTTNYWRSGSIPNCWHASNGFIVDNSSVTATTFSGSIINTSGTPQSGGRHYFCHGEIQ
jgi:hypothetical protein